MKIETTLLILIPVIVAVTSSYLTYYFATKSKKNDVTKIPVRMYAIIKGCFRTFAIMLTTKANKIITVNSTNNS